MLTGAHVIISSTKADADRVFLRDALGLPSVDVGRGWLIFGLPPAEMAVHPARKNNDHQFYFMVDDIKTFAAAMKRKRVKCTVPRDQGWGVLAEITLPGGGRVGVYEPRHARPKPMRAARSRASQV
jgi:hypothetical protein